MADKKSGWKQGPLPPDTWNWGGVVLVGQSNWGFYWADFQGDHATIYPPEAGRRVEADEIALYNNCLELPPNVTKRAGATNG